MKLDALTAATFTPFRGERFRIAPGEGPGFEVELIEVSEGQDAGASRAPFSVIFRGGPDPPLAQQIHRVEHDRIGSLDIFLVPLGPDEVGQRYEAVFT